MENSLSAKLFRMGTLMYGRKPSIAEVVRWLEASGEIEEQFLKRRAVRLLKSVANHFAALLRRALHFPELELPN